MLGKIRENFVVFVLEINAVIENVRCMFKIMIEMNLFD